VLKGKAGKATELLATLRPNGNPPPRRTLSGDKTCEFSVRLKVVTPILGGGPKLRKLDDVDIIRVPTVRGHLRFWWRALYGYLYSSPGDLFKDESALWGRAADDKGGGCSAVEVRIEDRQPVGVVDPTNNIPASQFYALWPAAEQRADRARNKPRVPPAPRRLIGTCFDLSIRGPREVSIKGTKYDGRIVLSNTVRAWIVFGGYGSRTRRGLGSLTVTDAQCEWLPSLDKKSGLALALNESLKRLLGPELFKDGGTHETPTLAGSHLWVSPPVKGAERDPERAWTIALDWLKEFRQGTASGARAGGGGGFGRSNWPEADKIRHLTNVWCRPQHDPTGRHSRVPAWPRAGFGLPIVGKFKDGCDPGPFELRWRSVHGDHDRLASPLIVKAMPLADGRFVPMALWLARANPDQSEVYLKDVNRSHQRFDVLEAPADPTAGINKDLALFKLLRNQTSLQTVFFSYLKSRGASKVAP
jgi:CRISPR-associated protein Cmr1